MQHIKIGIAIASFNNNQLLKECLENVYSNTFKNLYVVVVDDNSTDGTAEMIIHHYPKVKILIGSGEYWWTRGTNVAIKQCLAVGCDYIMVLNPDVKIPREGIKILYDTSLRYPDSIIAPVVVDSSNQHKVWWAGSVWKKVWRIPPVWSSKYLYKTGSNINYLSSEIYETSEAHGRAVLIPSHIFKKVGLYNQELFPHYGADTDFSFRVWNAGYSVLINPQIKVLLYTSNTGSLKGSKKHISLQNYINMLTNRKNGEILFVWWKLLTNHLPLYSAIPSYFFIVFLNTYRYWFNNNS